MEKLQNISKREIWLRAGVSPKTYDKYLKGESLRYKTAKKIKDTIAKILKEINELESELSNFQFMYYIPFNCILDYNVPFNTITDGCKKYRQGKSQSWSNKKDTKDKRKVLIDIDSIPSCPKCSL